jgi:hypothetical protein
MIGPVLLLHGVTGGWDELIVLAAGIVLAIFVVKWTSRSARDEDDEEDGAASDAVSEKPTEHS